MFIQLTLGWYMVLECSETVPEISIYLQKECPRSNHFLGDSDYSVSTYLLVPVRDNGHLTPEQKTYNNAHSSKRVDIERCFRLLKVKFAKSSS